MIPVDEGLSNADWTKKTWDIRDDEGKVIRTAEGLRGIGWSDEEIDSLKTLPAGEAVPGKFPVADPRTAPPVDATDRMFSDADTMRQILTTVESP